MLEIVVGWPEQELKPSEREEEKNNDDDVVDEEESKKNEKKAISLKAFREAEAL